MDLFYLDRLYDEALVGATEGDQANNRNNQVILYDHNGNLVLRGHATFDETSINISNEFERITGLAGDALNFYNNLRQAGIKYSALANGGIGAVSKVLKKAFDSGDGGTSGLDSFLDTLTGLAKKTDSVIQHYAQMAPDTADSYLYMFKGTNITTPTRFSKLWLTSSYDEESIYTRVKNDLKRFIGQFTTEEDDTGFIGFTKAPNDFKATLNALKSVNTSPEGTFTMWYGRQNFRGMVVTDIDLTLSRTNIKFGSKDYRPLYINADFTVRPVVKYTSKNFDKWLT